MLFASIQSPERTQSSERVPFQMCASAFCTLPFHVPVRLNSLSGTLNTEDSIRILSKHVPLLDPKVARQQFINMQKLLRTKNTEGKPLGWQSAEDWKETLDGLEQYAGMKGRLAVEEYFTNDFIEGKR